MIEEGEKMDHMDGETPILFYESTLDIMKILKSLGIKGMQMIKTQIRVDSKSEEQRQEILNYLKTHQNITIEEVLKMIEK